MKLEIYAEGLKHWRQIILYKQDLRCPENTYVSDLKFATHSMSSRMACISSLCLIFSLSSSLFFLVSLTTTLRKRFSSLMVRLSIALTYSCST
jgi:hypothetical protein